MIHMTNKEYNEFFDRVVARQKKIAGNSNFYMDKGWEANTHKTVFRAFFEELGLIKVLPEEQEETWNKLRD